MSDPIELEENFVLTVSDQGYADPIDHAATHADGGADELLLTLVQISDAGNMAAQNKNSVDIEGGTIDNTVIGATTKAAGGFTTLTVTSNASVTGTLTVTGAVALTAKLAVTEGGTGSGTQAGARSGLGIGSIGTQNANAVAITGGTVTGITTLSSTGGALNGTIGAITPAAGTFTTLISTGGAVNGTIGAGTPAAGAFTTLAVTGAVTLTTALTVANGGTGAATLTGILLGNGTSAFTTLTSATPGQVLRCVTSGTYGFGAVDLDDTDAVTGTLAIANGGTNAATVAAARTNLEIRTEVGTLVLGEVVLTISGATAASFVIACHSGVIVSGFGTLRVRPGIPANGQVTVTSYDATGVLLTGDVNEIVVYCIG